MKIFNFHQKNCTKGTDDTIFCKICENGCKKVEMKQNTKK